MDLREESTTDKQTVWRMQNDCTKQSIME